MAIDNGLPTKSHLYLAMNTTDQDINYILNHLGEERSLYYQAVAPPIMQTSNFVFPTLADFRQRFAHEYDAHVYTRGNNPTVAILRQKLAALEGTEDCLVFGSGSAAISAAVMSQVAAGDHVVCVASPYSWTKHLLTAYLPRFGVAATFADGADLEALAAAFQPNTRLLYLESPNSLMLGLQDLEACAALARSRGAITAIDNSYCTPLYQQPHQLGIDLVIHSATKYLNGHSDVVAGVVCGSRALLENIFANEYMTLGAIISPHDAALILRGLRTLPLRLARSNDSALQIARRLEQHPKVEQVLHPLLPSFPQYELAGRQMRGAGGLFSVYFRADTPEQMERFIGRVKYFLMAVSWGGHESLMLPMAGFYNIPGRPVPGISFRLVRFYIGLEDPDWLMADLEQALEAL